MEVLSYEYSENWVRKLPVFPKGLIGIVLRGHNDGSRMLVTAETTRVELNHFREENFASRVHYLSCGLKSLYSCEPGKEEYHFD